MTALDFLDTQDLNFIKFNRFILEDNYYDFYTPNGEFHIGDYNKSELSGNLAKYNEKITSFLQNVSIVELNKFVDTVLAENNIKYEKSDDELLED
jgi:spore cortex formation protein SpoVR/YcgB (stage V sporulation)